MHMGTGSHFDFDLRGRICLRAVAWLFLLCTPAFAQSIPLAAHPPMGWNSWDSYGLTVTEEAFRANVTAQSEQLKSFGWTYSVIDEGWYLRNPLEHSTPGRLVFELDGYGRYIPVPARFPSALEGGSNTGFAALGRWVHSLGLQFGIHIIRGIPRESVRRDLPVEGSSFHAKDVADTTDVCPWDSTNWGVRDDAAGQAWYDSLMHQYAGWGVDLIKVDCISDHPYKVSEIRQIHRAIERSGRPIVLSLSPGPTALAHAAEVGELAQMWRISDDVWDVWKSDKAFPRSVSSQFGLLAAWAPYAHAGNWPDADMLPIGELRPAPEIGPGPRHTRLTLPEQRTLISLWSIARSPLILGANLTLLDEQTTRLITNRTLIRIDQQATASKELPRQNSTQEALTVWKAMLPTGETALAFFNRGDTVLPVEEEFAALGYSRAPQRFENVWQPDGKRRSHKFTASIPPHDCVVLLVDREPGH
jgi:alpha-galactosidase